MVETWTAATIIACQDDGDLCLLQGSKACLSFPNWYLCYKFFSKQASMLDEYSLVGYHGTRLHVFVILMLMIGTSSFCLSDSILPAEFGFGWGTSTRSGGIKTSSRLQMEYRPVFDDGSGNGSLLNG
ncbi:hypothetical protein PM082_013638 [Marasmius tenuissimus]|nr:hypothetical protein PM082_013638 [Marasmius tenuissimus]